MSAETELRLTHTIYAAQWLIVANIQASVAILALLLASVASVLEAVFATVCCALVAAMNAVGAGMSYRWSDQARRELRDDLSPGRP